MPPRWRRWRSTPAPRSVRWPSLSLPEGRQMVAAHVLRPWCDAGVVVGIERVAGSVVVADRGPLLVDERAPADRRAGRAFIEVDAGDAALEAAVLDHVPDAR